MSTIDGVTFCDARDQAAMLAREPAFAVPCEVARGGCGADKGEACEPGMTAGLAAGASGLSAGSVDAELRREIACAEGMAMPANMRAIVTGAVTIALSKYRLALDEGAREIDAANMLAGARATVHQIGRDPLAIQVSGHALADLNGIYERPLPDASASLLRDLRDLATRKTQHLYIGHCPEHAADDARDLACPACDVLRRVDAALADDDATSCTSCSSAIPHAVGGCAMAAALERDPLLPAKLNALPASVPLFPGAPPPIEAVNPRVVPCVAVLVTDSAGRLLLVHTRRGWELPGGRLEPGETWRDGIARELREETGLDVILDAGEPRVFDGMPVHGAQYQSLIVIARGTIDGEPQPAPEVGDAVHEARWFAAPDVPLDRLSNIATFAIVREWLEAALAPRWPPPPGVHVEVLHGSPEGPLLIALVRLDPGAEVPREVHADQSETIFPLSGRLEIEDGIASPSWQTEYDSAPIVIDPDVQHVVRNASATEPAVYVAILRRVASVSDTGPAPALPASMTEAQQEALRFCQTPECPPREEYAKFRVAYKMDLDDAWLSLEMIGLLDDNWIITGSGRVALAALAAAPKSAGEER